MPNYSFATLTGHAAKDADLRFSAEGKAFTNLLVAVNRKYGNKETVTWWKVLVFGKPAEWAGEIKKGDVVQASGEPYMEEWTDKEGNKRYTLTLSAMTVINHSYKKEKVEKQAPSYNDMPDSDIPFLFNMNTICDTMGTSKSLIRARHGKVMSLVWANKGHF